MDLTEQFEKIREQFRRSDFLSTVLAAGHEFKETNAPGISKNEAYVIGALYAIWRSQATWENQ